MSNRQSQVPVVKFEAVAEDIPPPPGEWIFLFGVFYPAAAIGIELVTRMCAGAFFDPMPTWWHAAIVASVPPGNMLIWTQLREGSLRHAHWLNFVNGAVIAIAARIDAQPGKPQCAFACQAMKAPIVAIAPCAKLIVFVVMKTSTSAIAIAP